MIVTLKTIDALKSGEYEAFKTIYLTYFEKVKWFINGHIRSEKDAEDLSQDVFAKIWTIRETIDTKLSFQSFLFTMSRNVIYNYLKHKLIHTNYVNDFILRQKNDTPEELVFAKEIELLVEMKLSRMPEKRRNIYRLSRQKGLSNNEIAILLNISRKTVENNLSLAISELRKTILCKDRL